MNKNQLEDLLAKGLSTYKISKILEVSHSSVQYYLGKYELVANVIRPKDSIFTFPENKICKICKEDLPISSFYIRKKKEGLRPSSYCKKCTGTKTNSTERRRTTKLKLIEYKGGKCELCGYNTCTAALEFHHLDPKEKEFAISQVDTRSKVNFETLKKEVEKCMLLCANCHREIHYNKAQI